MSDSLSRRQLLTRAGAAGAALSLGGLIPSPRAMATSGNLGRYPFVAGVASGDPGPDRVVLWTKLALDALGEEPLPARRVPVAWEIADDERMRRVRRSGLALSDPDRNHSIHVELGGLRPGREYWYRFYAGGEASPVGRTRTAPAFGHSPQTLRFCFVSCSQFEHGYFTAYKRIVELREAQVRPDGSLQLFRELPMGDLCDIIVADTRQFRTDQPCDDKFNSNCAGMTDPAATLPGLPQERWLVNRFARSRARWNMLAQQVQMAQEDFVGGPGEGYNTDSWDGYKESRRRVLSGIQRSGARNPVVLTGDVHQHYAADLKVDFTDAAAPVVASEFVGTSISSGGDGNDTVQSAALHENPWIKYNANRRGYVRIDMDRSRLRADLQILPYVSRPDAPATTGAAFVIEDGRPGLQPA